MSSLISLLPLVLLFVVMWLFMIRPQQKRAKEHRQMVEQLQARSTCDYNRRHQRYSSCSR